MSDFTIRPLRDDEQRGSNALFRGAMHIGPADDADWTRAAPGFQPGRTLGAFDGELIGTARSFDAELVVPGGSRVPLAGVTSVGVRADHTRRGVLRALMTTQLEELASHGVTAASLRATESAIYGRFGYGHATQTRAYTIDRRRAVPRPNLPVTGEVTVADLDDAVRRWPEFYAGFPHTRPGTMVRTRWIWPFYENATRRIREPVRTAVHHGPDGVDGFATYYVHGDWKQHTLELADLITATPGAFAGLWRFLLGVDLVDSIHAEERPLDDGVELLLSDIRHCTIDRVADETWLRLIDVPAALAAREYGRAEPVVLEVVDPLLPANEGGYRIGPDGAARTDAPADLRLGVDALAMIYLGTWRPSSLATAGRIEVRDPAAAVAADVLFGTRVQAWCGTFF